MSGPIARILLRYGMGALVAKGLISLDLGNEIMADANIIAVTEVMIGAAIGGLVEGYYYLAKRWGWAV